MPSLSPASATWVLFGIFAVTWVGAALWTNRAASSLPTREGLPLVAGGILFCALLALAAWHFPGLRNRLWEPNPWLDWTLVALCAAGFAWCWWARLHMGRLWAGGVVVRDDHRVVDSGPFGVVRHPIYSGAFVSVLAFAGVRARPGVLLFAAGFIVFFALKARVEERFLRSHLGSAYDDYSRRVPMLVPRLLPRTAPSGAAQ